MSIRLYIGLLTAALAAYPLRAAILEVETALVIVEATVSTGSDPSIGWIDTSMLTDFETTTVQDQLERYRELKKTLAGNEPEQLTAYEPWNEAPSQLLEYYAAFPNDEKLALRAASTLYRRGKPEASIQVLEGALTYHPDSAPLVELLTGILVTENQLQRAIAFAAEAKIRLPDSRTLWFNTACAYAKYGNLDEAIHHLTVAAQIQWEDMLYLLNDPDFDAIRAAPAFTSIQDLLSLRLLKSVFGAPVDAEAPPTL